MKYSELEKKLRYNKEKIYETGMCAFDGFTAMQHYNAFYYIWDLIEDIKPSTIIEIGTAAGGLTRFLKFACNELNVNSRVISYDRSVNPFNKMITPDLGIDLRIKDCFHGDENNLNELISDIQSEGRCIVLCDGGNKVKEFNILSDYLKTGDIIMSHDYAYDSQDFTDNIKGKIWNWCESKFENLKDSVERNHLLSYRQDLFSKAVWACFIKSQ